MINCRGQTEQAAIDVCRNYISQGVLEAAWILRYQKLLRYRGKWHVEERNLFPGHVLVSLSDAQKEKHPLDTVLADLFPQESKEERQRSLYAMGKGSEERLKAFCRGGTLIGLSRGCIQGGRIQVTQGPLSGYEGNIQKIDRHKRTAWLEMPGDGQKEAFDGTMPDRICLGLEIYEKKP